uniref:Zinc finger, CCHC-type n=1 Tax=Tanacetum cinerariifolium TaxID=118510 RepID=A0A6L2J364_TANCI|nr:zinc finger, CCHC-type [Tanacetum cinerariifolium]
MLHMKEDETIDTFTKKLTTLVNKAASLGHTMEDGTLVRKLLNAVPDRLKTYEEMIMYKKGKQVDNQEKLMFTQHENKGKYFKGRGRGKHKFSQDRNHENPKEERKDGETSHKNYNRNNSKKSNYDTSKLQCYKCKKIRHIAPKCPQRTKPNEQSNLVEEDLEPTLLMEILKDEEQNVSLHEENVGYKETNKDSLWYLDNGASNHMTGVREHFKELDKKVSGKVRFGDGSYIEIKGEGLILIECDDEKQRIISHVYYIPDLKSNLLSLGQFTEIGCKVVMEDDELRLYDMDNKIFMKVTRQRNRLYKANLRIGTPVCLLANLKDDTWLWHARLGHLNFESLKSMAQRDLVREIPTTKHTTQVCDVCLIGKHSRARFPKKEKTRSTSPLDLVYGDLCGPITPLTPSRKKYILLLVDDYSRYIRKKKYDNHVHDKMYDESNKHAQNFWVEAVRHAIYILNSVPTKALEDITPYEAIKRRKPNLENLRVFGCIAYAKVPSQHLTKLDDRSTRMVYLGNEQGSKSYRLIDPTTHRICVSRDVKFKENETWDWKDYMKDNEFPNNDDNYASPTRDSPSHFQTPHIPSTRSSEVNSQVKPNILTQSHYQSDNDSIQTINSPSHFDHTSLRGFRTLNDLYKNTEQLLLAEDEPKNYKEASSDQKWIEAMKVELDSINRNNTWELTTLPKGHKAIGLKWVFKTKKDANGNIIKHKARLVAKGYIQEHGIDFEEVFTPVARMETIRLLLVIAANNKWEVHYLDVKSAFLHGDLKKKSYYLGIEVTQTNGDISIRQSAYANKILKEAGMLDCNETLIPMDLGTRLTKVTERTMVNSTEYRSLIGCLKYLLHTRPDLSYSIGLLSRFMQEPREQHMKSIRQVLRYVKGTKDHGITYKHNGGNKIHGYSDSSYGVNTQKGKGTTDIIFYYGESPISWSTQKQATVALSSCESEFIPATAAATQALWLKRLLSKLTHSQEEKVTIQVDNKSAIALMKNPVFHERSKHIDTKYHFIRECVEREDIQVEFITGEYQKANILTKALTKIKFLTMRQLIGLKDLYNEIKNYWNTRLAKKAHNDQINVVSNHFQEQLKKRKDKECENETDTNVVTSKTVRCSKTHFSLRTQQIQPLKSNLVEIKDVLNSKPIELAVEFPFYLQDSITITNNNNPSSFNLDVKMGEGSSLSGLFNMDFTYPFNLNDQMVKEGDMLSGSSITATADTIEALSKEILDYFNSISKIGGEWLYTL